MGWLFWIYLLSGTAAVSFVLAGALLGRATRRGAPTTPPAGDRRELDELGRALSGARAENERLQALAARLELAEQVASEAAQARDRASQELAQRAQDLTQRAQELAAERAERARLEAECARLGREAAARPALTLPLPPARDPEPLRVELATARRAQAEAQAQVQTLTRQLEQARATGAAGEARQRELTQLRGELEQLRRRHAESEQKLVARTRELEQSRAAAASAAGESRAAERHRVELEALQRHHDTELATLRRELEAARAGVDQVQALELELERFRAEAAQAATMRVELETRATQQQELEQERDELLVRLESVQAYLRRAQDENKQLAARVRDAESRAGATALPVGAVAAAGVGLELAELESSRRELRELRLRQQSLVDQLAAAESARDEHLRLAEELRQARGARDELAAAESELKQLRLRLGLAEERAAEAEALREENRGLRAAHSELVSAAAGSSELTAENRELRLELGRGAARLLELERLQQQNAELRDRLDALSDAEARGARFEELEREHKQLRLEAELLRLRVLEHAAEAADQAELRARVEELDAALLEAGQLRHRVSHLEARLFALGESLDDTPTSSVLPRPRHELGEEVAGLVDHQRVRTAVLADVHGLVVESAGDSTTEEGLAAASGICARAAVQVRELLPLAPIHTVRLADENAMEIVCRVVTAGDDVFMLATLGSGAPTERDLARVAQVASQALQAELDAHEVPVTH